MPCPVGAARVLDEEDKARVARKIEELVGIFILEGLYSGSDLALSGRV